MSHAGPEFPHRRRNTGILLAAALACWLAGGLVPASGAPSCDDVDAAVLFRTTSPGREPRAFFAQRASIRSHRPKDAVEPVHLSRATLARLDGLDDVRLLLSVFDGCVRLPVLHRRPGVATGVQTWSSDPTPVGPRAYLCIARTKDPSGHARPVVYLSADLSWQRLEIVPAGDPSVGEGLDYVARRGDARATGARCVLGHRDADQDARDQAAIDRFFRHRRRRRGEWADDGSRIELAVGWTEETLLAASGNVASIRTRAAAGVLRFSDALVNSGIPCHVLIRGWAATGVWESNYASAPDFDQALLQAAHDNVPLRWARRIHRCDMATMLCALGMDWGEAYVWTDRNHWFGHRAYSIVRWQHLGWEDALAHECGHNMGCAHEDLATPAQVAFAHGYYVAQSPTYALCSILARPPSGSFGGPVQLYCDPHLHVDVGGVAVHFGTAAHNDNARVIAHNLLQVANWGNQIWWILPLNGP